MTSHPLLRPLTDGASVQTRTHDLTEPLGQSPLVWAKRRATAENRLADLVKRCAKHHYDTIDTNAIYTDSIRMLTQALIAEGRLTEEVAVERMRVHLALAQLNERIRLGGLALTTTATTADPSSVAAAADDAPTPAADLLLEAAQMVVGELIAYRIISDNEAVARLCEYQLLYLEPAVQRLATTPRSTH